MYTRDFEQTCILRLSFDVVQLSVLIGRASGSMPRRVLSINKHILDTWTLFVLISVMWVLDNMCQLQQTVVSVSSAPV